MTLHIQKEINEQPDVISRLINRQQDTVKSIAAAIRTFNPSFISIVARGTSDNAGRYAQYLLGIRAGIPVALATPSVHTLYGATPNYSNGLVIGISQSGQSADLQHVLRDAKASGALTVAITNDSASPLAQITAHHIDIGAGEEISVAATKSYTAQLTAIALLVAHLIDNADMHADLQLLPEHVSTTLELADDIPKLTERYRYMDHFASIGRGYNYCTAFEVSLKIKELCYITGEEYSEADFRHGPIAVVSPGFPTLVIAPKGKTLNGILDLFTKLKERNAECLVISNDETALSYAQTSMRIPDVPEWLSPITTVIPGQIFAMSLAKYKGHSVDMPTGLSKVTSTV